MPLTQLRIANWCIRLGRIAIDIGNQLHGAQVSGWSKHLLGLTSRQAIILQDLHFLLRDNPARQLTSTFILFRCLLDDFITLLYFRSGNFSDDDLIRHTAENSFRQLYKNYAESRDINNLYFAGENPNLATQDYIDEQLAEVKANPAFDIYFEDKSINRFKSFPSTAELIHQLPTRFIEHGEARACAHALVLFKLLSNYVHYSEFTYRLETTPETRQIELSQLQEALSYVYKGLIFTSEQLNNMGLTNVFRDPDQLHHEVFEGFI